MIIWPSWWHKVFKFPIVRKTVIKAKDKHLNFIDKLKGSLF